MTGDPPPRPRAAAPAVTRKGRRSSDAFKVAAAQVFTDRGVLNSTVADIAKEAGRSPAAFYYHFESKEHILFELFRDMAIEVQSGERQRYDPTLSPRAQIDQVTRRFWATYRRWLPVVVGVFQLSMVDETYHQRWIEVRFEEVRAIRAWVREAQRHGHAAELDADFAASALAAMLDGFCYMWLARGGDVRTVILDDEVAQRTLSALCYHALYGDTADG
jgi:AcrR family transcriptional regulator